MSVAWVGAGIAAVSVASNASSAKKAGKAQQAGADASIASQEYMFDETNRLNQPFRDSGLLGNNALMYGLGLGGGQYSANGMGLANTSSGTWTPNRELYDTNPQYKNAWDQFIVEHKEKYGVDPGQGSDTSALPAELYARGFNSYANAPGEAGRGDLLKKFDENDLNSDVVYNSGLQFGLDEGTKAINRMGAANGGLQSGAIAKALTRFGNDYGSTKAGDAYNRYTNDQNNKFNKLASTSGIGQVATNQIASAGQNMANNNSATQIGLGNARGASAIAQGNALSNGLSSAYNGYQQNQLMNTFANRNTGYGVAQQPGVTDWVSQG